MNAQDVVSGAFERHAEALRKTAAGLMPDIVVAGELLVAAAHADKVLFVCGNGGSAADAQHLVAEYTCKYKDDRRPLPAVALTANTSHLTAVSNDFSFDDVFSRQLETLAHEGDVLVAITTSGGSKNILKAIVTAHAKKVKIIILTGEKGEHLRSEADVLIAVPSSETARIQEMHELIYHAWCEFVDAKI